MAEDYRKALLGLIQDDLKVTQKEAIAILEKGGEKLLRAFLGANITSVKKILEEILGQQIQFGEKATEEFEKQEKRKYEKSGKYAKDKKETAEKDHEDDLDRIKEAKKTEQKSKEQQAAEDEIAEQTRLAGIHKEHDTRMDNLKLVAGEQSGLFSLAKEFSLDVLGKQVDGNKELADISVTLHEKAVGMAEQQHAIGTSQFQALDVTKDIEKKQVEINAAKHKEAELSERIVKAKAEGNEDLHDDLVNQAAVQKLLIERNEHEIKGLKTIDAHSKVQEEQHNHLVNYKKTQEDLLKPMEELKTKLKSWSNTLTSIVSNPMVLLVTLIAAAAKHFAGTAESAMKFRKGLGLTADSTKEIEESAMNVAKNMSKAGQSFDDSLTAARSIVTTMGDVNAATEENIFMVSKMSKALGMSTDESAKFLENMSELAGITMEEAGHLAAATTELSRAAGVAPSEVIADMNANSEGFAAHMKDGGKNLAEAAVFAAKLGTSVSEMVKTADALLNIEQSLQDEMEAEALLGRDINLEKARQLAYDGDIAAMSAEISKQVGTAADWDKMRAHEKQALAKAMGMEVGEMAKMISKQETLQKLADGQLSTQEAMAAGLSFKDVMDTGNVNDSITNIKNSISAIAFNLLEVFRPVFEGLAPILSGLATGLSFIAKILNSSIGKFFVWFFVAIQTFRALQQGHWLREKIHMLWKSKFGVASFFKRMAQIKAERAAKRAAAAEEKAAAVANATSGGTAKVAKGGPGKVTGALGRMNVGKVLAGAAALVIVASALLVFAKALQEMPTTPGPYIGAAVGLTVLVAALFAIGALMMSGVGAVALLAGAAAMVVMASAVLVLGHAIQAVGKGFSMLGTGLGVIGEQIVLLAEHVSSIFLIAAAFGMFGLSLVSLAAGLALITPLLPTLMAVAAVGGIAMGVMNMMGGGEETGPATESPGGGGGVEAKLDRLISLVERGGVINMDGKKVGEVLGSSVMRPVVG